MNNKYINIEITFPEELRDITIALISDFPFLGIIEKEDSIVISFYKKDMNAELLDNLNSVLADYLDKIAIGEFEEIEETNWNEEWEKEVPSIVVNNKIGIAPTWKLDELKTEIKISINPKMSFGTGSHETTKLCCLLIDQIEDKGSEWIDAGTGTGILAILLAKLGVPKIIAFDNNEWAVRNSEENILLNNVISQVEIDQFDLDNNELPIVDGIVANILADVIFRNLQKFYDSLKSNGKIILSGILIEQEEEVLTMANQVGFEFINKVHLNEWTGIYLIKK